MRVVVDASVAVSLALDPRRAPVIAEHWRGWEKAGASLHAPSLFRYEVASALTRSIVAGDLGRSDAELAWYEIVGMPIVLHELREGPAAIDVARRLKRQSAYDAAYIVLARSSRPRSGRSTVRSREMRRGPDFPCA